MKIEGIESLHLKIHCGSVKTVLNVKYIPSGSIDVLCILLCENKDSLGRLLRRWGLEWGIIAKRSLAVRAWIEEETWEKNEFKRTESEGGCVKVRRKLLLSHIGAFKN